MTSVAIDDTAGGGSSSLQTFQTQVSQESRGQFILTCDIARIRGGCTNRILDYLTVLLVFG